jgi:imidazolonepropionase-like amidohydrolase
MQAMDRSLALVGELHKAGMPIVLGTDLVVPGHSIHRELELAVRAGLTPLQALQAATIVSARALGLDREAGTLVVGKRADLVLIQGNPLDRISNVRNVRWVVTNGRSFSPAPLWRSVGFQPAPGLMR